jgi:K+-transporting ATPase ATPase A chain
MIHSWIQIGAVLLSIFVLSIPVGRYLADIVLDRKTRLDALFDPIDAAIYLLVGRSATRRPMDWRAYTFHVLATNLFMAVIIYLILVFQDQLPLNQMHFPRHGAAPCLQHGNQLHHEYRLAEL